MRGLELPEEEMSSRFSQTLLQASLLSYKDANAPRSQYSHSHRSSSTRGDSKSCSKYDTLLRHQLLFFALAVSSFKWDYLNELAASAKNNS